MTGGLGALRAGMDLTPTIDTKENTDNKTDIITPIVDQTKTIEDNKTQEKEKVVNEIKTELEDLKKETDNTKTEIITPIPNPNNTKTDIITPIPNPNNTKTDIITPIPNPNNTKTDIITPIPEPTIEENKDVEMEKGLSEELEKLGWKNIMWSDGIDVISKDTNEPIGKTKNLYAVGKDGTHYQLGTYDFDKDGNVGKFDNDNNFSQISEIELKLANGEPVDPKYDITLNVTANGKFDKIEVNDNIWLKTRHESTLALYDKFNFEAMPSLISAGEEYKEMVQMINIFKNNKPKLEGPDYYGNYSVKLSDSQILVLKPEYTPEKNDDGVIVPVVKGFTIFDENTIITPTEHSQGFDKDGNSITTEGYAFFFNGHHYEAVIQNDEGNETIFIDQIRDRNILVPERLNNRVEVSSEADKIIAHERYNDILIKYSFQKNTESKKIVNGEHREYDNGEEAINISNLYNANTGLIEPLPGYDNRVEGIQARIKEINEQPIDEIDFFDRNLLKDAPTWMKNNPTAHQWMRNMFNTTDRNSLTQRNKGKDPLKGIKIKNTKDGNERYYFLEYTDHKYNKDGDIISQDIKLIENKNANTELFERMKMINIWLKGMKLVEEAKYGYGKQGFKSLEDKIFNVNKIPFTNEAEFNAWVNKAGMIFDDGYDLAKVIEEQDFSKVKIERNIVLQDKLVEAKDYQGNVILDANNKPIMVLPTEKLIFTFDIDGNINQVKGEDTDPDTKEPGLVALTQGSQREKFFYRPVYKKNGEIVMLSTKRQFRDYPIAPTINITDPALKPFNDTEKSIIQKGHTAIMNILNGKYQGQDFGEHNYVQGKDRIEDVLTEDIEEYLKFLKTSTENHNPKKTEAFWTIFKNYGIDDKRMGAYNYGDYLAKKELPENIASFDAKSEANKFYSKFVLSLQNKIHNTYTTSEVPQPFTAGIRDYFNAAIGEGAQSYKEADDDIITFDESMQEKLNTQTDKKTVGDVSDVLKGAKVETAEEIAAREQQAARDKKIREYQERIKAQQEAEDRKTDEKLKEALESIE